MYITKNEAKYTLPKECCGNCKHSSRNTYDDCICAILIPTDRVIDIGGVCNKWEHE